MSIYKRAGKNWRKSQTYHWIQKRIINSGLFGAKNPAISNYATFEVRFLCFHGQKSFLNLFKNIVAFELKSYIPMWFFWTDSLQLTLIVRQQSIELFFSFYRHSAHFSLISSILSNKNPLSARI